LIILLLNLDIGNLATKKLDASQGNKSLAFLGTSGDSFAEKRCFRRFIVMHRMEVRHSSLLNLQCKMSVWFFLLAAPFLLDLVVGTKSALEDGNVVSTALYILEGGRTRKARVREGELDVN
jgi:hypothetical protein